MLVLSIVSAIVALPLTASAFPASKTTIIQKLAGAPAGWIKQDGGKVDKAGTNIKLRIHLTQPRMNEFYDLALKIATPGDELYGKHLSKEELDSMLAPKAESSQLVMDWLKSEGLAGHSELSKEGDTVVVNAPVQNIEKLLRTEYSPFVDKGSGNVVMRTLQYSLPDSLQGHIDMVQPTTFFGMKSMRLAIKDKAALASITPSGLSRMYSYGDAQAYSTGRMGIAGFLEEHPSQSDLSSFLKKYGTQKNNDQSYTCIAINNGTCPTNGGGQPGTEANLDVQYARAITEKIPNVYYSTGGRPPANGGVDDNEPYLEFLNYLLGLADGDLPNTVSISYGDDEASVPDDYATNCCNLFSKLGARGVSVLVASGDSGVGDSCPDNKFTTSFPASCPWVTVVGGTTGSGPESAWSLSGGGFSDLFPRPSYQDKTVKYWLQNDQTHAGVAQYFNSTGRAYPDVAAAATDFVIVISGGSTYVDGTSAACPTFASIIQLLNSDRLSNGKKPLGFLNPWIYSSAASGLTDITSGSNSGCSSIQGAGFQAVPGWDPATGLGSPNYDALLKISRTT